jgi:hypothetical protein
MKMLISRSFNRMPQAKLTNFSSTVYMRMSEDPQFVGFKNSIDELKVLNEALSVALSNAADGGKALTVIKDRCLEAVVNRLGYLANDVEELAKGDEVIVLAAGFEVRLAPTPIKDISIPSNLTVVNAPRSGEIKASWKTQYGVVNFGILYQIQGETEWRNGTYSTSKEVILSGFNPGTVVSVKIYAIGNRGLKSDATEPVSVMVI